MSRQTGGILVLLGVVAIVGAGLIWGTADEVILWKLLVGMFFLAGAGIGIGLLAERIIRERRYEEEAEEVPEEEVEEEAAEEAVEVPETEELPVAEE